MKKIFFSIMAVAALAACTKSEVQYEPAGEIGFTPVTRTITKAALGVPDENGDVDNTYPTEQNVGVWANYDGAIAHNATPDYAKNFKTSYIADKQFTYHADVNPQSWAGVTPYFWPTNGSLVFAGYSMTAPTTAGTEASAVGTSRSYDFATDEMKINGYVQSLDPVSTFDLLWFGRTAKSYNLRNQAAAVPVVFSHALSWITIQAKGQGTVVDSENPWRITSLVINNVASKGDVTMVGAGANAATWTNVGDADANTNNNNITVFTGDESLATTEAVFETTDYGTVVIPQTPTAVDATNPVATLTVKYKYNTPAGVEIEEESTVSLSLAGAKDKDGNDLASTHTGWQSGTHYIYTLTFSQNEILIAPTVEGWTEVNQGVTVN